MEHVYREEKNNRGENDTEYVPVPIENIVKLRGVHIMYKAHEERARVGSVKIVAEKYRVA